MTPYMLASSLDTAAAALLRSELLVRIEHGQEIEMDGSEVVRIGQACLQVLVGARAAALGKGLGFTVRAPSAALRDMAALARLDAVLEPAA